MKPLGVVACGLVALASAWPVRAERVEIGVSVRRDESTMCGAFTGEQEGPRDAFLSERLDVGCREEYPIVHTRIGVLVAVPLSRRFALRVDPAFATGGDQYYEKTLRLVRLDYLEVPVYARFLIVPDRGIRPYLLAGFFVAKRRNHDVAEDVYSAGSRPGEARFFTRKELWRGWNAGVSGGGGVSLFEGTPLQLFGEIVFERGLVDVYGGRNLDRHTRTMRMAGGLSFRVGRR